MKVICTGFPKTGTKSICAALRILDYNVYDFEEQCWFIGDELKSLLDNGCTSEEIIGMLQGVDAVTDFPACAVWELLFKAFPDVKVVHCERNSEDEWFTSFVNHIGTKTRNSIYFRLLLILTYTGRKFQSLVSSAWRVACGCEPTNNWRKRRVNKEVMKLKYRQHNSYVKQVVPKRQFLEFKICGGWEQLCDFLKVPVPEQEFPHENKKGAYADLLLNQSLIFQQAKRELFFGLTACGIIVSYVSYTCYTSLLP